MTKKYEAPNLEDLPRMAVVKNPSTDELVIIQRGHTGYWPLPDSYTQEDINKINEGIDDATLEAMQHGSVFGFDLPIANPELYRDKEEEKGNGD